MAFPRWNFEERSSFVFNWFTNRSDVPLSIEPSGFVSFTCAICSGVPGSIGFVRHMYVLVVQT
jgi:hypothetical protein